MGGMMLHQFVANHIKRMLYEMRSIINLFSLSRQLQEFEIFYPLKFGKFVLDRKSDQFVDIVFSKQILTILIDRDNHHV